GLVLHVVTYIRTTCSIFAMPGDTTEKRFKDSAADSTATTENFAENIEWVVKPATKTSALFERGMTEPIVSGALVRIHQDVVGLAQFLEFFFGVRVVRVFIGLNFYGEL